MRVVLLLCADLSWRNTAAAKIYHSIAVAVVSRVSVLADRTAWTTVFHQFTWCSAACRWISSSRLLLRLSLLLLLLLLLFARIPLSHSVSFDTTTVALRICCTLNSSFVSLVRLADGRQPTQQEWSPADRQPRVWVPEKQRQAVNRDSTDYRVKWIVRTLLLIA